MSRKKWITWRLVIIVGFILIFISALFASEILELSILKRILLTPFFYLPVFILIMLGDLKFMSCVKCRRYLGRGAWLSGVCPRCGAPLDDGDNEGGGAEKK